jgi:uncharacterized membrane protein YozB (DUF420 family)
MSVESSNRFGVGTIETPAAEVASRHTRRVKVDRWFYIGAAVFMILLSAVGFGPSFIDTNKRNAPPTPIVLAHGIVAAAWLLLFLAQATLVATRRTALHRRIGKAAPIIAALMIVFGYITVIEFARRGYDLSGDLGRAPLPPGIPPATGDQFVAGILAPLVGFVNFGILMAVGLWFRNRPEVHKRLMLLAVLSLSLTPLIHVSGNVVGRWPTTSGILGIAVPLVANLLLFIGAVHDKLSRGRIHPISIWVPILLIGELFGLVPIVMQSAPWRQMVLWLVAE